MVIIHKDFRLRLEERSLSHLLVYSDKKSTLLSLFEDCPPPTRSKKRSSGIPWKWAIPISRGRAASVVGALAMNINSQSTKKIRKKKNESSG